MRKRLRKKKHIGEFREFGVNVKIEMRDESQFESWVDDFILNCIEANGCSVGGGTDYASFNGFIELGIGRVKAGLNRESIEKWLNASDEVIQFEFGQTVDARYGPFED